MFNRYVLYLIRSLSIIYISIVIVFDKIHIYNGYSLLITIKRWFLTAFSTLSRYRGSTWVWDSRIHSDPHLYGNIGPRTREGRLDQRPQRHRWSFFNQRLQVLQHTLTSDYRGVTEGSRRVHGGSTRGAGVQKGPSAGSRVTTYFNITPSQPVLVSRAGLPMDYQHWGA